MASNWGYRDRHVVRAHLNGYEFCLAWAVVRDRLRNEGYALVRAPRRSALAKVEAGAWPMPWVPKQGFSL